LLAAATAAILLSACGGGGGSSAPPPPSPGSFDVTLLAGSLKTPGAQDGRGEAAGLNYPVNVAADAAGNLYVSDAGNHTIRKITPDGTVSTLAGSPGQEGAADGAGAAARFSYPSGIAVDAAGNVFVADTGNHAVRKISPAGDVSTHAGQPGQNGSVDGPRGVAKLTTPVDVAMAADGDLLVVGWDYAVRKVAPDGSIRSFAGRIGDASYIGPDAIVNPTSIAVDGSGNVYVSTGTSPSAALRKFSPSGQLLPFPDGATTRLLPFTADIAADAQGNVYIASGGASVPVPNPASHSIYNSIHRLGTDGVLQRLAGIDLQPGSLDGPAAQALLDRPVGIALAPGGRLVFVDNGNRAVRELGADGVVRTLAGGAGLGRIDAQGAAARFSAPGPMVAFNGHLYVGEQRTPGALRRVAPDGTVTTVSLVDEATGAAIPFVGSRLAESKNVLDVAATATRLFVALHTYGIASGFATVWSCNEALRCRPVYEGTTASMAADLNGNLYVVGSGAVQRIAPDGTRLTLLTGLQYVPTIRADAKGLVLAQQQAHVVQRYDFDGRLTLEVGKIDERGEADGSAAQARFDTPRYFTLDAAGNVYVVDASRKVRRIADDGSVVTMATLPGAPNGLAWMGGTLYATVFNAVLRLTPTR
jgi:sugar lactone lactonase YvrE